jgi:rod shape determining protein RodA
MAGISVSPQTGSRTLRRIDWWLLVSAGLLLLIGLAALYSIDHSRRGSSIFEGQVLRVLVGLVPLAVMLKVQPRFWQRWSSLLYAINLILLGAVLVVGIRGGGAVRWVDFGPFEFQPSEMSKLITALTLAAFFADRQDKIDRFSTFALSFLHILAPAILVFKQPHLGATIVLIVIWLSISIVARVPARFIMAPIIAVVALLTAGLFVPGILKDYQKERLVSMVRGSEQDERFQAVRAEIAFGSGGVTGAGFLKGEQKAGGYVPEQHTDFIFTVVGEEGGFVGCALVVGAFAFFFYRGWLIMFKLTDQFAKLVAAGILGALAFHTIVNLYMNVQLMPVVGLWLPFLSYGGTAMWLCLASVGLLVRLRQAEKPLLF